MAGKVMKVIGNVFTVIIILIVSMSLFSLIQYRKNPNKPPSVFGYSAMSVLTGSMRPYLEPGDMIIDKAIDADEVKVGDVLTYRLGSSIVTHRVTEIIAKDGNLLFETRGDANNTDDSRPVTEDQLIGKVILRVPYGGYVARFIRSPIGLMIFIVIPVAMMLIGELMKGILSGGKNEKQENLKSEDSVNID
jgi:signal peptidase